jgi:hypothetical protein
MLDFIEKAAEDSEAYRCMEQFYALTLEAFQSTNNERLWLKTNIKLARLWLDRKDYRQLTEKVRELHKACQKEDGTDDPSKGTYSLEVYSLEILMYAETRNNKRLKVSSYPGSHCGCMTILRYDRPCTNELSKCVPQYLIPKSWESSANVVARCT